MLVTTRERSCHHECTTSEQVLITSNATSYVGVFQIIPHCARTVEAINKQTQRQMKLRQAYMQANQSADAEGYGDPEDEDEPVAAGDDDDDSWSVSNADSWSVSNADSSEDEDEHEDAISQLKTVLEFQMLGSLLASTDMSNHPVDTFMATLRHCAKCHTVASLGERALNFIPSRRVTQDAQFECRRQ